MAGLHAETAGVEALIALGSFEALTADRFAKIEALCAEKYNGSIFFAAVTFEELLSALPKDKVSKNLADVIDDFEGYLDETWLLPRWKHRLDVVNCGRTHTEIGKENVYLCPAKGGAYNHSRGKFFGMYRGKTVGKVALSRRSHATIKPLRHVLGEPIGPRRDKLGHDVRGKVVQVRAGIEDHAVGHRAPPQGRLNRCE